jgi:hypothetical protein
MMFSSAHQFGAQLHATHHYGGGFGSSPNPGGIGNETAVVGTPAAGLVFGVGAGNHGSYDAFTVHNLNTERIDLNHAVWVPNTGGASTMTLSDSGDRSEHLERFWLGIGARITHRPASGSLRTLLGSAPHAGCQQRRILFTAARIDVWE